MESQHPLACRDRLCLEELADYSIGHLFGLYRNGSAEWEEFKRRCDEKGFFPRSVNMGWEVSPGWGNWHLPDCVLVFPTDLRDNERLDDYGKKRIPIRDAAYEIYAVTRPDDEAANALIDRALVALRGKPAPKVTPDREV